MSNLVIEHNKFASVSDETTKAPPTMSSFKRRPKFKPRKEAIDPQEPTRQKDPRRPPRQLEGEPNFEAKARSTSFPPPKSDPSDIDAFSVLDLAGLTFRKKIQSLNLNFSGYLDLSDAVYETLAATEKYWTRNITLSMWTYYSTMLLWERLIYIATVQGDRRTQDYIALRNAIPTDVTVPTAMASYLSMIGPFTDPNKRKWHVNVPRVTDQQSTSIAGWFGRVSETTHYLYGSTPSPGVAALSVIMESAGGNPPSLWNLPPDIRPNNRQAILPNKNLLGHVRRTAITPEIRALYERFGIHAQWVVPQPPPDDEYEDLPPVDPPHLEEVDFGETVLNMPVNKKLLTYISDKLNVAKTPSIKGPVETVNGSQTQLGFILATSSGRPNYLRITESTIMPRCYSMLTTTRANAIGVLKPRVCYNEDPSCFIYTFENRQVNRGWINTRNNHFNVEAASVNSEKFKLSNIDGQAATQGFVALVASSGLRA